MRGDKSKSQPINLNERAWRIRYEPIIIHVRCINMTVRFHYLWTNKQLIGRVRIFLFFVPSAHRYIAPVWHDARSIWALSKEQIVFCLSAAINKFKKSGTIEICAPRLNLCRTEVVCCDVCECVWLEGVWLVLSTVFLAHIPNSNDMGIGIGYTLVFLMYNCICNLFIY